MVHLMQYVRSFKEVEPWKSAVSRELDPLPNQTHEQLRGHSFRSYLFAIFTDLRAEYIKKTHVPCWRTFFFWLAHHASVLIDVPHPDAMGTCSMMPRNHQGVVDAKLKVYGTTNLRIADLSIVPLNIAAHPQGKFVYVAVAIESQLMLNAF